MAYFPMCVDLTGKQVLLVGNGPEIMDKMEKMRPFGAELVRCDTLDHVDNSVAFVIVGDLERDAAQQISCLCRTRGIPVNVVDDPGLSTFFFPAMINQGSLTVSVSTGGKSPGAAAHLIRMLGSHLPEGTGEIIDWLGRLRKRLYESMSADTAKKILRHAADCAFDQGRCLTDGEIEKITADQR